MRLVDVLAVAAFFLSTWLISAGWDVLSGRWRASTAPTLADLRAAVVSPGLHRPTFAASVMLTIPATYWFSLRLGLLKPYWTLFALVLVLRVDFVTSGRLMLQRFVGTVHGVCLAGAFAYLLPDHRAILVGIFLCALVRWPAQRRSAALGVGAINA